MSTTADAGKFTREVGTHPLGDGKVARRMHCFGDRRNVSQALIFFPLVSPCQRSAAVRVPVAVDVYFLSKKKGPRDAYSGVVEYVVACVCQGTVDLSESRERVPHHPRHPLHRSKHPLQATGGGTRTTVDSHAWNDASTPLLRLYRDRTDR